MDLPNHLRFIEKSDIEIQLCVVHPYGDGLRIGVVKGHPVIRWKGCALHEPVHLLLRGDRMFQMNRNFFRSQSKKESAKKCSYFNAGSFCSCGASFETFGIIVFCDAGICH